MISKATRFLIVGLGLMGGSYAAALSEKGYTVTAIDPNADSIAYALEKGLIHEGTTGDPAPLVREADCIILAIYPDAVLSWLAANASHIQPGTILTDLCGVKSCFVDKAQSLLPHNEFIPSHPMAGREVSGVRNATAAMFQNANFLITPTEHNTPQGISFARELATTLGFARITEIPAGEHDRIIGYVSQLTHAIAVSLMNANADPRLPEVTGDSFRDLTRIADINEELWSELFLANAPALCEEIDQFTATLNELKGYVQEYDKQNLKRIMRQSAQRRRAFTKKQQKD